MVTPAGLLARVLYGVLFVVAVPVALWLWARRLGPVVPLDAVHTSAGGTAIGATGLGLLALGIADLIRRGRGLPMNAFPPPLFVRAGVFRWLRNPIYIGFGLLVTGVALGVGSAAGLWVVAPVTALSMMALVWGYERHDLVARFGPSALDPPLLSLPRGGEAPPTPSARAAVYVWVLLPWLVVYELVQALGRAPDAFGLALPLERTWPVVQWTEAVYVSAYLFVPLAPLVARRSHGLRRFAIAGMVSTLIVSLCWLVVPVVATNRPFEPHGAWGRLLAFEQATSKGVAAFPAFHVLWALLVADLWADNTRATGRIWWAATGWIWAAAIAASTLTTGMHTVLEVAAASALFCVVRDPDAGLERMRRLTERLANSWREWRIGPVRIINYGAYAAAAAGTGVLIAGMALGTHPWAVTWVAICILVGAGTWAQWLEGSSRLLRPFGWYGGVVGAVAGTTTAALAGVPLLPLMASYACAAPFIQIWGRLRCLVNGCCHGGPAPASLGIRYLHRRSRVTRLAGLANQPLHPTPLYSIAANLLIGLALLRLRALGAADVLVLGLYLILSGIARFVEESYRAEPQTRIIAGLHLYQWLAIGQAAAGIVTTTLPDVARTAGFAAPTPDLIAGAMLMALLAGAALGVDFPRSNRAYSRLAEAD
ncbi:MAG: prolipoprotein diacylglyceryl transferase family protein [Vicinamibacterales bacterium]